MTDPTRRSVVTGGAGFIGSHVVDRLLADGDEVVVVDNLASGKLERVDPRATFVQLDVSDLDALLALVDEHGPFDRWYHLAAQADVRVSVERPLHDATVNVLGTIAVLEAARRDGAQVVFTSTGGAIYGEADLPTPEAADERPESPYGTAKLGAEKYVAMDARMYGAPHAVVRFANVYGPRQDPHGEAGVVAIFGGRALVGEAPYIFGDGTTTRDYVYVGDVVEATIAAGEVARGRLDAAGSGANGGSDGSPAGGGGTATAIATATVPVWNVGTGVETSVGELWNVIARLAGIDVAAINAEPRVGEIQHSALDASLAREELGVGIDTSLEQGLSATLDWMRTDG